MTREDLLAVLPCYVCGDLPAEVKAALDELVASDPEAAALFADISASHGTCKEALRQAAPALVRIEEARVAAARARPVSIAWPLLLALGVLLALGGMTRSIGPGPDAAVAAQMDTWISMDPRSLSGFVESEDVELLSAALRAGGALPTSSKLRAPSTPGLRLTGAAPLEDGGYVLIFVDAGGQEYRCFSVPERPFPLVGALELPDAPPDAPALRSFAWGGERAVTWRTRGRLCVLIGDAPRALVEGVARAKVWGARG